MEQGLMKLNGVRENTEDDGETERIRARAEMSQPSNGSGVETRRADTSTNPFDFERIRSEWKFQIVFLLRMLHDFRREAETDIAALEEAFSAEDTERVARLAHRLKGAAALLCAESLQERAAILEALGKMNDLSAALKCMSGVRREIDRCNDYISALESKYDS